MTPLHRNIIHARQPVIPVMICCALFATLFAQPIALLAAIGLRLPKTQLCASAGTSRGSSLPAIAILAEVVFVTIMGMAFAARLQAVGPLQHICRFLLDAPPLHTSRQVDDSRLLVPSRPRRYEQALR